MPLLVNAQVRPEEASEVTRDVPEHPSAKISTKPFPDDGWLAVNLAFSQHVLAANPIYVAEIQTELTRCGVDAVARPLWP